MQQRAAIREAVGVFTTEAGLQQAIDELLSSGFGRTELSLLAAEETVEHILGHKYRKVSNIEDNPAVPCTFYVPTESIGEAEGYAVGTLLYVGTVAATGAVVASGGTLAAAISTAALASGTGDFIGSVLAHRIGQHHAEHLQLQLDHGSLLLWVRTLDKKHEECAIRILEKHSGQDVYLHDLTESAT